MTDDDPLTASRKRKRRNKGPAEGHKKLSWIWQGADGDANKGATDSLVENHDSDMVTSEHDDTDNAKTGVCAR